MGPTASGKSALAMALARALPVEIISVDSAQVYRDMNVGTAKPGAEDRAAVPHHLIDLIEPTQSYSAARFVAEAPILMNEIHARGRLPLLVGGTMLYFKALREGLSELPPAHAGLRAQIEEEAAAHGWPALHAELASVDPLSAARLEPQDAQRIQRALEIYRSSGKTMSALLGARSAAKLPFTLLEFALQPSDRGVLHERIARRFEAMLKNGLVEEVRSLQSSYALNPALASMRCVGYRQTWSHLAGEYNRDELRERGIFATRQLAKRQLTWLRATPITESFDCVSDGFIEHSRDSILRRLDNKGEPK